MAIGTPTDLGTGQSKVSGTTLTITTLAAIPAGALVVVCITNDIGSLNTISSISDGTNTGYKSSGGLENIVAASLTHEIWYMENAVAVSSSATITINMSTSTAKSAAAFYCTGIAASSSLDGFPVSTPASGSGTAVSIATGAATSQANELIVVSFGLARVIGDTFTITSAHTAPPTRVATTGNPATSNRMTEGGSQVVSSTGTQTFTATITSAAWAGAIACFIGIVDASPSISGVSSTGAAASLSMREVFLNAGTQWNSVSRLGNITFSNNNYTIKVAAWDAAVLDLNFMLGTLPGSVTFSRASTANYFNSAGFLSTGSTDVARFDYDPVTLNLKGLLIEETRTNLLLRSNNFSPSWSLTNSTTTFATVVSPVGSVNGWTWQRSSASSAYIEQDVTKAASSITYTASIFGQAGTGNFIALRLQGTNPALSDVVFNVSNGTISTAATGINGFTGASATIQSVGNGGWYRLSLTATTDTNTLISFLWSGSTNGIVVDGTDSSTSTTIFAFGAQMEQAAYATSYIGTTTAAVTRADDVATVATSGFLWNDASGSFAITATTLGQNAANGRYIGGNNSTDHPAFIAQNGGNTSITSWNGTNSFSITDAIINLAATTKMAMSWSATGRSLTANNLPPVTDVFSVNGGVPVTVLNIMGVSNVIASGWIQRLRYYNQRLPDSLLQGLTI